MAAIIEILTCRKETERDWIKKCRKKEKMKEREGKGKDYK